MRWKIAAIILAGALLVLVYSGRALKAQDEQRKTPPMANLLTANKVTVTRLTDHAVFADGVVIGFSCVAVNDKPECYVLTQTKVNLKDALTH